MRGEEGLERFVKAQKTDYEESLSEMKLRSSMTLFHLADPSEDIFKKVLEKFCFNHKSYGMTGSGHNPFD